MTTYYPFTPSQIAPFSFQPTLDGSQYLATVSWLLYGQRFYITVAQLNGIPVFTLPVIESPTTIPIGALSWANGKAKVTTLIPHGYQVGLTVAVTIENCQPSGYNGSVFAYVYDPVTLIYPITGDPGAATALGAVDWFVNIARGYFVTSTLVFRNGSFEVNP